MIGKVFATPKGNRVEIKGEWGPYWLLESPPHYKGGSPYKFTMDKLLVRDLIDLGHYTETVKYSEYIKGL